MGVLPNDKMDCRIGRGGGVGMLLWEGRWERQVHSFGGKGDRTQAVMYITRLVIEGT